MARIEPETLEEPAMPLQGAFELDFSGNDLELYDGTRMATTEAAVTEPMANGNSGETALLSNQTRFISFHNISYTVKQTAFMPKKSTSKIILNDVSGIMNVGLHAIMGPTGSGKTSLLDILADRKAKRGLSGHVLINGKRQPKNFKCASAYVVQDDILVGTLTVQENLMFSATLRLSASYNWEAQKKKVHNIINELGLEKVANSKIGTELVRGISGGERKRASIGMELIISPNFVFLDEPTTGLDSATAVSVIKLLKDLSNAGRVVILAIHQPRYSIFRLFDSLTLLSNGELIYHGSINSTLDFFGKIGYTCEQYNNPADFLIDVIQENSISQSDNNVSIAACYKKSEEYKRIQSVLYPILDRSLFETRGKTPKYNSHFLWQILVVSARTILNSTRDPLLALTQIVVMSCLAVLVGIVFLQVEDSFVGVQNRLGAFFFILINLLFGNLFSIEYVIREKVIFRHENISGYYRVSAYLLAKVLCDIIPLRVIPTVAFGIITYWMIGLEDEASTFFVFLLTLILTSIAASGVALIVGALVNVIALANIIAAFIYIFMLVFAGFLININSLGGWISWLQYFSIFRYSLHALAVNEMSNNIYCDTFLTFDDLTNTTVSMCNFTQAIIGDVFLENQNFTEFPLWQNELALLLFTVAFFILAYTFLRIMKKER